MKKVMFCIVACFLGGSAFAQECPIIDNDLDRLACYDKESGRSPTVEVEPASVGKWSMRKEKSEFKDTTDVYLSLRSDGVLTCGFGSNDNANLILICKENTTTMYIATNCHLMSGIGSYGTIEYRIDDRKAAKRNFTESTDNKALGLWNGGRSIPMIKKMLDANTILMRFTPYSESPESVKFNITGLDEAILPLREACNW